MLIQNKTTIDIGKGKSFGYSSEAKDKFISHGVSNTIDKETRHQLNYLKQNHFELGADKTDFGTVNKMDYSAKENPGYTKHHGENQKTSFKIGFHGNPFNAQTPSGGNASTDRSRPRPHPRAASEVGNNQLSSKGSVQMQRENFSLGKDNGEFRTMNQAYYRWIQPRGDNSAN